MTVLKGWGNKLHVVFFLRGEAWADRGLFFFFFNACPKIKSSCPNSTLFFCPKMATWKFSGKLKVQTGLMLNGCPPPQWRIYGGGGGVRGFKPPPPLGLPSKNLMCIEKRHHYVQTHTVCSYSTLSQAQPQTIGFNPPPPLGLPSEHVICA